MVEITDVKSDSSEHIIINNKKIRIRPPGADRSELIVKDGSSSALEALKIAFLKHSCGYDVVSDADLDVILREALVKEIGPDGLCKMLVKAVQNYCNNP